MSQTRPCGEERAYSRFVNVARYIQVINTDVERQPPILGDKTGPSKLHLYQLVVIVKAASKLTYNVRPDGYKLQHENRSKQNVPELRVVPNSIYAQGGKHCQTT